MKRNLLYFLIVVANSVYAQNSNGNLNDIERIVLTSYVPQQIEKMPEEARGYLESKLSQIITQNGIGATAFNQRFIITANINVESKDILPTTPPMQALTLNITFLIGDGVDGTLFSSISKTVKGVGENETKAYIAALKNLKTNDSTFRPFILNGKTKIVGYYNSKCDFLIKSAQTLASQNKFEEAIYNLTCVPEICKSCFEKCMEAIAPIYKRLINRDCKLKLMEAANLWGANQTVEAGKQAGKILSTIEPDADCYVEVKALMNKISERFKEIDKREWNYKLKEQAQKSELINAYRDIGVAYGNGQPKNVTYNIREW
jgi:hypothetical protein